MVKHFCDRCKEELTKRSAATTFREGPLTLEIRVQTGAYEGELCKSCLCDVIMGRELVLPGPPDKS